MQFLFSNAPHKNPSIKEAAGTRLNQEQTINQLNKIEAQIKGLKMQEGKNPAMMNLSADKITSIHNKLMQLWQYVDDLATHQDAQHTQAIVVSTGNDMDSHINSMRVLLKQIKRQITPVRYLPAKALPFKVVSVRGINGVLNAIIQSQGEYIPLVKNETYGDWQLIQVSYDPQETIFENKAKQMVKMQISS